MRITRNSLETAWAERVGHRCGLRRYGVRGISWLEPTAFPETGFS